MIAHPDGFAWPERLDVEQVAWLVAWAEKLGDVHIADAKVMRDEEADGGLTLALVVDLPLGLNTAGMKPFAIMAAMPAPSDTFPHRFVLAIEWPRFEALVAEARPKKPALSLVPMEGA